MRILLPIAVLSVGVLFVSSESEGVEPETGPATASLTAEVRAQVISALSELLEETYVIPETADELIRMLEKNRAAGLYDSATDRASFAGALTEDLRDLSGDMHLQVMPGDRIEPRTPRIVRQVPGESAPARAPGGATPDATPGGAMPSQTTEGSSQPVRIVRTAPSGGSAGGVFDDAIGIAESKMLPGKVGYVDIRLFIPRAQGEQEAVEAMATVEQAEAIIFDLRMCGGGTPEMVHFITSYLYTAEPKHLLTYYHAREEPEEAYTLEEIPGRRMPDVPVYILTSPMTASGGEEFSYNLKHHGRATLVGETTAGGGHGGSVHPVAAGFHAFIPDFRPVHPVTGKGWEGVGVVPNIESSNAKAETVAYELALETLLERTEDPSRRSELQAAIEELEAQNSKEIARAALGAEELAEYVGKFGYRTITADGGSLYLQRTGGPKLKMLPEGGGDEFTLEMLPQAQIRFSRDEDSGAIEALHVLAMSGKWEVTHRDDRN